MSDEVKKEDTHKDANSSARELSAEELDLVSGGAVDIFLTIDGIKGESTKSGAEGWIEI